MKYLQAVAEWNRKRREVNTAHVYAVPRRGTTEYDQVKSIAGVPGFVEKKAAAAKALGAGAKAKAAKDLRREIDERIEKRKAPPAEEIYDDFTKEDAKPPAPKGKRVNPTVVCEICGGKYTKANKAKHTKTERHVGAVGRLKTATVVPTAIANRIPTDQEDTRAFSQDNRAELDLLIELSKRLARLKSKNDSDDEL
jgi:hypothetical protein